MKMKKFEPKSIYEVLQPLFAWTRIFGLTPFKTQRDGYKHSNYIVAATIFILIFFCALSVHMIVTRFTLPTEGFMIAVTDVLEIYVSNVNMLLGIVAALLFKDKIMSIIDKLHKIDEEMNTLCLTFDFRSSYKTSALYITIFLFVINIYLFFSFLFDVYMHWMHNFMYTAIESLVYLCPKAVTTYVLMQFSVLNILLGQRFALLNRQLYNVIENIKSPMNERLVEHIDSIRLRHFDLCDLAYELNSAYSVQLLCVTLQIFVILLASIFYCIRHIMKNNENSDDLCVMLVYTGNIALLSFAQIVGVATSCSRTTFHAKKTGSLIHKAFPITKENDLELELLFFSMQLLHHNVDFTACNMFRIDESLLLSICGAICTYLVIIVQFEFGAKAT